MLTKRGFEVTWRTLARAVVCVLAGIGALAIVQAQQRAATPTLTAADRLEIHELLHRYMFVLDSCPDHNNGYDYADLYTEDGQFNGGRKGREALARAAGRTSDGGCKPIRHRGLINQIHINVAPIIDPSPEGARGISYLMMIDGPTNEIYWNGWYQDIYARTPKGWRFKSRNHVGHTRVGVPSDLSSARALWEEEPTPNGSRSLVGKGALTQTAPLNPDPLKWLASGLPSVPAGN
jgi:SnoaL-like domain